MIWSITQVVVIIGIVIYIIERLRSHYENYDERWRREARMVRGLLQPHFPAGLDSLVASERCFPLRARADLQRFLEQRLPGLLNTEAPHAVQASTYHSHEGLTVDQLLSGQESDAAQLTTLAWTSIDIGESEPLSVFDSAVLWLGQLEEQAVALVMSERQRYGETDGWRLILLHPSGLDGQPLFDAAERALRESSCYRGKMLSLVNDGPQYMTSMLRICVHRLEPVERAAIILPGPTLNAISRNVIDHARHSSALASRSQAVRKGVLLHGPPGTGKTYCVRWLANSLPDHTILLISGDQLQYITEYFTLARMLEPAVVVIEDVDLIARERNGKNQAGELLLNKLLNEMDGLRPDARLIFLLTTNRPEAIEPALASRPGRIDQAIAVPLPDEECRRRLIALYGGGLRIGDAERELMVRRSEGASAAFIKELVRRAALYAEMRQSTAHIAEQDVDAALEELLNAGGELSRRLLGASSPND